MLKITLLPTNQIVLDTGNTTGNERNEMVTNRYGGFGEALVMSITNIPAEGMSVFIITMQCPDDVLIRIETTAWTRVMSFIMSGVIHLSDTDKERKTVMLPENSYHHFSMNARQCTELLVRGDAKLFMVCITGESISKLVQAEESLLLQKQSKGLTTAPMTELIQMVIRGAASNTLHRILLVAKLLELLFLDLEQQKKAIHQTELPAIRFADRQKLEQARLLIGENLQTPCSLIELAHKVGLNDFKLKKGFKEVFGTTVFGYLTDLRMEKAKAMLLSVNYTVSEVAHVVGYKNAHHFTVAYKKKFGYLPSKTNPVRGNRF